MRIAAADYGKSHLSQVLEILKLAFASGHLTAKEYYNYRLFDDSQFTFSDKQKYIGFASQEQIKKFLINVRWKILSDDKFIFATLFQSQNFPLAKILATYNYGPNQRDCGIPSFRTTNDLRSFLENGVQYPFFGKPVAESYGLGCIKINGFDQTTKQMTLAQGESIAIDQFIKSLQQFSDGYMFQEVVHPHRVIRELCGDRVASVRVVVLLDRHGPQIFRAGWKIPTGDNISDNFQHGQSGNLLAAVDIEDGRVGKLVQGLGVDQKCLERHPDTGEQIQGVVLPYWRELKELCLEAAVLLPGFNLQSWDIVICDEGPILQEVQGGDFDVLQVSAQKGMLDDSLRQLLKTRNKFWQREIALSYLAAMPRRMYRQLHATPKSSALDHVEG
jgi:hypothetical protein